MCLALNGTRATAFYNSASSKRSITILFASAHLLFVTSVSYKTRSSWLRAFSITATMRPRRASTASNGSSPEECEALIRFICLQELGSMYDYLAKVILLGPSGCGKCVTSNSSHRSLGLISHQIVSPPQGSQERMYGMREPTIGVEFSSKIIKIGTGAGRKRIKLQLWDTAGTERFRSVSRSYYRGAAGAILVYDISSRDSFLGLSTFLDDARALASPDLTVLLAGNKSDLIGDSSESRSTDEAPSFTPSSTPSRQSTGANKGLPDHAGPRKRKGSSSHSSSPFNLGAHQTVTLPADEGRQVGQEEAARWASRLSIPVAKEVSAYTGDGVDELFGRLARIILTKIELGEIDPDDPLSGIQYGDSGGWMDDGSINSGTTFDNAGGRRKKNRGYASGWRNGVREWQAPYKRIEATATTRIQDRAPDSNGVVTAAVRLEIGGVKRRR
ncbi:MAG: hypothetical protein Q9212_000954 [Teloschistes hypoglaucus]